MDALEKKDKDETNWFGVKIGSENANNGQGGGGGVGRYLQLGTKRPASVETLPATATASTFDAPDAKKRKIGFGNFEGW